MKLSDAIKRATRSHLVDFGGELYCQNVTAVGWVGGTVPDDIPGNKGIIELPTSDASNPGIVCGAAIAGKRPIYVIRYQGFMAYNNASLLNYAAKSKVMWDTPCPVFIRAIGMEGSMGPVATGMHHSMAVRTPGIKVFAPMTPSEWIMVWIEYLAGDDPIYCSESRLAFNLDEMESCYNPDPDICIVAVGPARLAAREAVKYIVDKGWSVSIIDQVNLKPFSMKPSEYARIETAKMVLVVDSDYQSCGISEHICCELRSINPNCIPLGMEDKTAGFGASRDNKTPTADKIVNLVRNFYES